MFASSGKGADNSIGCPIGSTLVSFSVSLSTVSLVCVPSSSSHQSARFRETADNSFKENNHSGTMFEVERQETKRTRVNVQTSVIIYTLGTCPVQPTPTANE